MASFKRKKVTRKGDWSDVPPDNIGRIMEKLYWADRFRLPFVCTTWSLSVPRGIPVDPEFPWLLSLVHKYDREDQHTGTQLQFFNPLKEKSYRIHEGIDTFPDATIWCSRLGWLLLRNIRARNYCDDDLVCQTFLFSPLTREVIKLPMLENNYWEYKDVATFSMTSTSPECTVFVCWRNWNSAGIRTCRVGDNTWNSFDLVKGSGSQYFLETDDYFYPVDATYLEGSFYCLFRDGEVGVFNTALEQWKFLEQSGPRPRFSEYKFVHSSTDLLLCNFVCGSPQIWRYDIFTKNSWINEKDSDTGCWMIFLDYKNGHGVPLAASELAEDKAPLLVNKCYDPFNRRNRVIQFFSDKWLLNFDDKGKIFKELKHREVQIIWFDQRFVWRKSDLLTNR